MYPYEMVTYRAKLTSKNQLTLPAGVSALLHARPGDVVSFSVDEETGNVSVSGPEFSERLEPWLGRWAGEGDATTGEVDGWIREIRGARE
jgi:bifunctional DNA-binding transcriptional regulator/antitoxin component of YhaV-PrlF toxin-antitoxin module